MPRVLRRMLLIGVCVSLSATAYGQFARQSVLPSPRELDRFGLERAWWNQAVIDTGTDRLAHLVVDENCVFTQSHRGLVTAFDAESGQRLWSRLLGTTDAPNFPVVTNADHLLLASGMELFGLNKFDGRLLWRLADLIVEHAPRLAEIEQRDNGKLITEVVSQVRYMGDYFRYCSKHDPDSPGVRACMSANGHKLTKTCVNALVKAGEVSQAEVNRRSASMKSARAR